MATNIIGHPDKRRYNPARDIAYCWPHIMKSAMDRLSEETALPWFVSLIDKYEVPDKNIEDAAKAMALYMALCNKPDEGPSNALFIMDRSGLTKCDGTAKMLLYAALGETMMVAFHAALRDVLMEDEPSPLNDAKLVAAVDKSMKLILEERSSYTSRLIRRIKSIFKKGKEA
jgi:hypothetical protein